MSLVLVTRRGCHLCDRALALLREFGHEPKLLDVDADDRLHDLYDWRVPVILDGDRIIAEGKIERARLRQALASLTSKTHSGSPRSTA